MDKGRLTYKGAVQTWECDSNRHMNVMYYINKFEHAGRNCGNEFGLKRDFLESNNYGIAVVEQNIQYKREVFEDDLIYITSKAKGHTNKVMNFEHSMYNSETDQLSAVMDIKLVIFDMKLRKAVPLPEFVKSNIKSDLES